MGKKSKSKSNTRRGADAPRPLGYTGKEQEPHMSAERIQALEQEEIQEFLNAKGTDAERITLDVLLEGVCNVEENGTVPVIDPLQVRKYLKRAPVGYVPSTEVVWRCARNDFSGKALQLMLEHNRGIVQCNKLHQLNDSTPLNVCCSRGNMRGLETMIRVAKEQGVTLDPRRAAKNHAEPLFWALQGRGNNHALGSVQDFCEIVKLLVGLGCDIESIATPNGIPIHGLVRACELGELPLVETCIKLGANVNGRSLHNGGMTPLHFCCKSGSTAITQLLLSHGADTRLTVNNYVLPIGYTLHSRNFACADLILRHEADLAAEGKPLPPLTKEQELFNCLELIRDGVQTFRETGDFGSSIPVVDLRTNENDKAYDQQSGERAKKSVPKVTKQCDGCGTYGTAFKKCTGCSKAQYCGREFQKKHWRVHKAACKKAQAQKKK